MGLVVFKVYEAVEHYFEYVRFKKEGVVFMNENSYSFIKDVARIVEVRNKHPNCFSQLKMFKNNFKDEPLPAIIGMITFGRVMLTFTSAE